MSDPVDPNLIPKYEAAYRPHPPFDRIPFDTSAFDYASFSNRVEGILSALDGGAVIAIDSPWGRGKTFFAKNFDELLRTRKAWETTYIDAFEYDYVEDPFLLIASAIRGKLKTPATKREFIDSAAKVGKALLPIVGKAVLRVATANVLDDQTTAEVSKAFTDAAGDATKQVIEERIKALEADHNSFTHFRDVLAKLSQKIKNETGHPFVVFVDELDRCRPTFALRLLERIKHLFDVPHLTFVLLLDAKQLERAVNGVYGKGIDSAAYLRKFIHFHISLPKRHQAEPGGTDEITAYIDSLSKRIYLAQRQGNVVTFRRALIECAIPFDLTFRDVERAFTQMILGCAKVDMDEFFMVCLTFLIVLRTKEPEIYRKLLSRDPDSLQQVRSALNNAKTRGLRDHLSELFFEMANAWTVPNWKASEQSVLNRMHWKYSMDPQRLLYSMAQLLDELPS